jgi:3-methyl-2-oxobutanoate hydroxymethyltransferase
MSTQNTSTEYKRITTKTVLAMKRSGEKIAMLTAYDYTTARMLDESGIDIILVGDSVANVFQGLETTIPVTVDEIIYHTKVVRRGVKRAMLVADMPFMSYQVDIKEAVRNCGRMLKESGAEAVKMEGGKRIIPLIEQLVDIGIPVMGHLGLTPQSIYKFGTYEVRARERAEAKQLIDDAKALDKAGVFGIVLEKIPNDLAAKVTTVGLLRYHRDRRRSILRRSGLGDERYARNERTVPSPFCPSICESHREYEECIQSIWR